MGKYIKIIFFIFNISILKQFENIKKIEKKIFFLKYF
jgi:hypothetical protein